MIPRRAWTAAACLAAAACAGPRPSPHSGSIDALLSAHPMAPGQALLSVEAARDRRASFHLVRIAAAEKPHRHDRHDLTVLLLSGRGRLRLEGRDHPMKEGDFIAVPRGAAHFFVNEAETPSAAWIVFTPPFDGKDIVPDSAP